MPLLYPVDKFFIGAIKFFDSKKDFGFIASNNCGTNRNTYIQDFYINTESFIDGQSLPDGTIVVFQIEAQKNKTRAVNVRRISKTEEDWELALTYYGDHEKIEIKDLQERNLFNAIGVPRDKTCRLALNIIVNDENRTPEQTLKHFSFLLSHFKYESFNKDKYIFDRDFYREQKNLWQEIFDTMTAEEKKLILTSYPSAIKYITDEDIVADWINSLNFDNPTAFELEKVRTTVKDLPDNIKEIGLSKIDDAIENLLDSKFSEIMEKQVSEIRYVQQCIEPLAKLSTKDLSSFVEKSLSQVKYFKFRNEFERYKNRLNESYERDHIVRAFNALGDEREKYLDEFRSELSIQFARLIETQSYYGIISMLKELPILGEDYKRSYRETLFPLIKDYLIAKLNECISNNSYRIEEFITQTVRDFTSIFTDEQKSEIRQAIADIIISSKSIYLLSLCSSYRVKWIDYTQAIDMAIAVISSWDYQELSSFIEYENDYFDNEPAYNNAIIDKGISLIANSYLLGSFATNTPPESDIDLSGSDWSNHTLYTNCKFLKNLYRFYLPQTPNKSWKDYISSRSFDEYLVLYRYEVISKLPQNIISSIIGTITLDSFLTNEKRWYDKPVLKDEFRKKLLTESTANLVPIVAQQLKEIELTATNIPLAVALVELMSINKPKDTEEYYVKRQWEQTFTSSIQQFKNSISDNLKLSIILWAVYHKTPGNIATLSQIFAYMPPYLQIRSVRWLFYLIATGRINYNARQLYNMLTKGEEKICFPLEIAFEYLAIREKYPSSGLTHNVMLKLLNDRGNDHDEWFHIKELMNTCQGRRYLEEQDSPNDNWRYSRDYYNGFVRDYPNNKITMFIPSKMIEINGTNCTLTGYNNKYASQLKELVEITFSQDDYSVISNENGITYQFDEKHKLTISSLSRCYNIKYNRISKKLGYKLDEEAKDYFCECRLADAPDNRYGVSFYWCDNKPCFVHPVRFKTSEEWEQYTMLDFMRILHIPIDYTSANGKTTKYGYYIYLSAYLKSFVKFYEHLNCRVCGKLMKPHGDITNFESRAINEFSCADKNCSEHGKVVYLNHCFNKKKCDATIDSRDSKQCPNGQYICPECGACCSTENFARRISNLHLTGGYIAHGLIQFVQENRGHWEKKEFFCYNCGRPMTLSNCECKCDVCNVHYKIPY